MVASLSKKYIAVPLTVYASLAHVPGEGLHFTKEVMQTCLHLVTMDMVLCETKPPICIANNQEWWRTPNLIFWPQSIPGSSTWMITRKTTTALGLHLIPWKQGMGCCLSEQAEAESHTPTKRMVFLVLPHVKKLADIYVWQSFSFPAFSHGEWELNRYVGKLK